MITAGPEGMVAIRGLLPPMEGAMLESLLRSVMDANWRADHPERAATLGGHGGDSRDQRRLDALLDLLGLGGRRCNDTNTGPTNTGPTNTGPTVGSDPLSASDPPIASEAATDDCATDRCADSRDCTDVADAGGHPDGATSTDATVPAGRAGATAGPAPAVRVIPAKPSVVIVFDIDRYQAEILGRGPIPVTPDLFDATKADLYYFFQNGRGEVLKFGRGRRDPTPAQRLAVEVRDRHCIYPHCREPASRCQVHHLNEWLLDDGFTDVEVLGLFCDPHHRHLHLVELIADLQPDGTVAISIRSTGEVIAIATPVQ